MTDQSRSVVNAEFPHRMFCSILDAEMWMVRFQRQFRAAALIHLGVRVGASAFERWNRQPTQIERRQMQVTVVGEPTPWWRLVVPFD